MSANFPADNIISSLAVFAVAGYRLMPALQNIYSGITMMKYNQAALDVLVKGLSLNVKRFSSQDKNLNDLSFTKSISLEEISFKYSKSNANVLSKLSLKINKYETIGLVGQTGSGKTTLVDILLGL